MWTLTVGTTKRAYNVIGAATLFAISPTPPNLALHPAIKIAIVNPSPSIVCTDASVATALMNSYTVAIYDTSPYVYIGNALTNVISAAFTSTTPTSIIANNTNILFMT